MMSTSQWMFGACLMSGLLFATQTSHGQVLSQDSGVRLASAELSTPAMKYFGRRAYTPVTRTQPRRPAPMPQQVRPVIAKPFQNINRGPVVTPYLQLDTPETTVGVPNYYSRVLPQIQQRDANRMQSNQLQTLQRQVRVANIAGSITNTRNGGVPTTGHSSQFMNNGGYFPTAQQ